MIKFYRAFTGMASLLLAVMLMSACQSIPTPATTQSPLATPGDRIASATEAAPTPETVPTPKAEYGVVSGTLVNSETVQPTSEVVLFLGELHGRENGFPIVAVDRQLSPKAFPASATGRFMFVDVPPGEYGLIYWDPDASFLVDQPDKVGESLIVTVKPGSVQDVGSLRVPPH